MTTLLIDADLLAYRAASATEFDMGVELEGSEDEDLYVRVGSLSQAYESARSQIDYVQKHLAGKDVVLCFSSNTNFRKSIYPGYKANRTGPKPVVFKALKAKLSEAFRTFERPGLEADDVMGILGTHPNIVKGPKIIVSEDKDMRQIPCWLYQRGELGHTEDCDRWHLMQTLMGDQTDNYPGCPGIGPKKAEALLPIDKPEHWWGNVVGAFAAAGLDESFALAQARVARILDAKLYDFNKKEPILWVPA